MPARTLVLRDRGAPQTLQIEGRAGAWKIERGGKSTSAQSAHLPDGRISILLEDGRQLCGRVLGRSRGELEISTARGVRRLSLADPLHDRADHPANDWSTGELPEEIHALMPGRVVAVAVGPGDSVEAGALLLVVEAMKMQNEIRAERAGVVENVDVAAGEAVESGTRMLTLRPAPV